MNRSIIVGRLTKDVDLRYSQSGVAVANFTVAVNRTFKTQDGQDADFINCVAFRNQAENLANYMKKGSQIGVDGRLQSRTYENKNGQTVFVTEIVADSVQFLESKGNSPKKADSSSNNDPFKNDAEPIDITGDDLPF